MEDIPEKNPENVIGEGDEPDNLVIYWTVSLLLLLIDFRLKNNYSCVQFKVWLSCNQIIIVSIEHP